MIRKEEAEIILKKLSKDLNVPYKLITERLLGDLDMDDIMMGYYSISSLRCHIGVFRDNGYLDCRSGSGKIMITDDYISGRKK